MITENFQKILLLDFLLLFGLTLWQQIAISTSRYFFNVTIF